jgi:hypothetical protein
MSSTPSDPTPEQGAVPPPPGGDVPPPPPGATPPPGYNAPPPGYAAAQPPLSDADQRMWAMLSHIGPIVLGFIAPLVIWLVFKERGRFVEEQAKESLNFQIMLAIAGVVFWIITIITLGFGGILFLAFIVALVFMIMAAIAANKGEPYRYPVNLRLIK